MNKKIKTITVALATITSLLYILYILSISVATYLHNRPIRTCVLSMAVVVIVAVVGERKTKKNKAKEVK